MSSKLDCQKPSAEVIFEAKCLCHWAEAGKEAKGCFEVQQEFLYENLLTYLSATVLQGACGYDAGEQGRL